MQIVGSMILADHSLAGACLQPNMRDSTCLIVRIRGQSSLLLLCQYSVAEDQAVLWAQVLYSSVSPKQTIILAGQVCHLPLDQDGDHIRVARWLTRVTRSVCSAKLVLSYLAGVHLHSLLSLLYRHNSCHLSTAASHVTSGPPVSHSLSGHMTFTEISTIDPANWCSQAETTASITARTHAAMC